MRGRRLPGGNGALQTVGSFRFQGNHEEEQSLGEKGGSTVPNSIPRDKLGEEIAGAAGQRRVGG